MSAAALFSWLASTPVYREAHLAAVAQVPAGLPGERWVDFGCGPGLITIAAATHGYDALGIDLEPGMIAVARRSARQQSSSAQFRVGDVATTVVAAAEVVSAASLLAVLDNPAAVLDRLWEAVAPGGTLLVVETTPTMTPRSVRAYQSEFDDRQSRRALRMWATARQGRAVDPALAAALPGATLSRVPLLGDMVELWKIVKHQTSG